MLVTTDDVIAAWLSPSRQLSIRVKMNDATYGSEDVTSLSFDSGSISGETYQIGSTYMNSIQLIFPSLIETVKEDMEVVPELGVLVNGTYEYTKLGHFFIDEFERNRNNNTTTIRATDKMRFMEGPYDSKLSYQKPYREVALEVANLAGVEINEASFSALGTAAINKPEGYTFRQAIGLIAQFEGGFASFNRNGELEIRRLAPTNFEITPESYMLKGFTKNEVSYRIGGITVKTGEEETDIIRVGSTNGSQVQLENKVMTQQLLTQIWELVKNLNYFPYELKWRGCPPLEAGDWIYITANDGTEYSVPNLSYSITFNGGMSAESKATTSSSSQATYKYRGPLNQRVDYLDSILSSNNWNSNYYDATEPPNPKEGDVWFKPNGKDTEIWVYKNVDGVLDWVMEITSAGDPELLAAIEKAKDEAEKAQNAANTAVDKANEAVAKVDSMDKAVNTALEQSASAIDQAQQAIKDANNLLTTVTEVQGTVTNISTVVDEINNQLAVKVSQTDFDKLKGTVDTQAIQISANAKDISLKSSQNSVDAITNNVTSIQSELKTQAGSITAINTKVEGNTIQIGTLESSYSGLTSTISSVKSDFDNLQVGSRNWVKNSESPKFVGYQGATIIYDEKQVVAEWGATNAVKHTVTGGTNATIVGTMGSGIQTYTNKATNYVHSIYVKNVGTTTLNINNNIGKNEDVLPGETKRVVISSISHATTNQAMQFVLYRKKQTDTLEFMIWHAQIEEATVVSAWKPAIETLATVTEMSNIAQTVKDIQLTVADKVSQAQFTILSNQVSTTVSDVSKMGDKLDLTDIKARMAGGLLITTDPEFREGTNGIVAYNNATDKTLVVVSRENMPTGSQPTASPYRFKITVNGIANPGYGGIVRLTNARMNGKFVVRFTAMLGSNFSFYHANNSIGDGGKTTWLTNRQGTGNWTEYAYLVECGSGGTFANFGHLYVQATTPHPQFPFSWYLASYEIFDITRSNQSQITQMSDLIDMRVMKGDVIGQITTEAGRVLIGAQSGETGNYLMITPDTTYIQNATIKSAHIADASITNAKIADATISSAKIINLDASKVTASTLSSIVSNTGNLNISGTLTVTTDNNGLTGTYNYGDVYGESLNPRYFVGTWNLRNRLLSYRSAVYNLTSSSQQGSLKYYASSMIGPDYFKFRSHANSDYTGLRSRLDMTSEYISMGTSFTDDRIKIYYDGGIALHNIHVGEINVATSRGYSALRLNVTGTNSCITLYPQESEQGVVINGEGHSGNASMWFGRTSGKARIWSTDLYNYTGSGSANLAINSNGTLYRATSARKYKTDIQKAEVVIENAKKILGIHPVSWLDKLELQLGEVPQRYYGFIADEFDECGLREVVVYGADGQVESLAYDRISMYHNVILTEHEKEINQLKKQVSTLENQVRVLQAA